MKKILVAMLLILPLIIVASVLLSASIITVTAYIAVEDVTLNVDTAKTLELPLSRGSFQLEAVVRPTGATNREVIWTIENMQCFGDETKYPVPASVDKNGKVTFVTYCTFDVLVTTVEGSKTARVNFYIKGDKAESISIREVESTVLTGQSVPLDAVCYPLDADIESVGWSSDNESVLSVDANGIIRGVGEGEATIKVNLTDKIFAEKKFTVVKGATKYGANFAVSKNFELSEIEPNGDVTVLSGGALDGTKFIFSDDVATFSIGNRAVTIQKCSSDAVVIENYDLLKNKLLRVGKLPIYLKGVYLDAFRTDIPQVTFVSGDETKATVDGDGKITALTKGNVTISSPQVSQSIQFLVVKPVTYIRLANIDGDDARGIAASTVYGNYDFINGEYVAHSYTLKIQYPSDAVWEDYDITLSDPSLGELEGNKLTLKPNVKGLTSLDVIVSAKYSAYESMGVKTVRHLKVIDGVNVTDYAKLKTVAGEGRNAVIMSNVAFPSDGQTVTLTANLYGNGYLLDATPMNKTSTTPIFAAGKGGIVVSNTHIRCDEATKINQPNGLSGIAFSVGKKDQPERFENITLEYSILENGYYAMECRNSSININGCIFRNTSNFGISILSDYNENFNVNDEEDPYYDYSNNDWTDLTMNNCVMSNIVAAGLGFTSNYDGEKLSSLHSTGFLDVYNWQDLTSARMLDRDLLPGKDNEKLNKMLSELIKSALESELQRDEYAQIRYTKNNGRKDINYIHMAGVSAGAVKPPADDITFEDKRMHKFTLTRIQDFAQLINTKLYPCDLYLYYNDADITPDSTFSETAKLYEELRSGRK